MKPIVYGFSLRFSPPLLLPKPSHPTVLRRFQWLSCDCRFSFLGLVGFPQPRFQTSFGLRSPIPWLYAPRGAPPFALMSGLGLPALPPTRVVFIEPSRCLHIHAALPNPHECHLAPTSRPFLPLLARLLRGALWCFEPQDPVGSCPFPPFSPPQATSLGRIEDFQISEKLSSSKPLCFQRHFWHLTSHSVYVRGSAIGRLCQELLVSRGPPAWLIPGTNRVGTHAFPSQYVWTHPTASYSLVAMNQFRSTDYSFVFTAYHSVPHLLFQKARCARFLSPLKYLFLQGVAHR